MALRPQSRLFCEDIWSARRSRLSQGSSRRKGRHTGAALLESKEDIGGVFGLGVTSGYVGDERSLEKSANRLVRKRCDFCSIFLLFAPATYWRRLGGKKSVLFFFPPFVSPEWRGRSTGRDGRARGSTYPVLGLAAAEHLAKAFHDGVCVLFLRGGREV